MRNALTIARKELLVYFTTPRAWMVFTGMAVLSSVFFIGFLTSFQQVHEMARAFTWARMPPEYASYKNLTDGVVVQLWGFVMIITLFLAPFLSMRLFAEEKRHKTFELLMTTPVRSSEIVAGKYLGALGVISATLGLTAVYPIILSIYGSSESGSALDMPTVLLGYLGLLLWGATCVAIGMFLSALTDSQVVAAILTFAVLLPWMLLNGVARGVEEPLRSVISHVSFDVQLQNFMKGVFDLSSLVFFLSIIALSLLLTQRAVEAQRWT